ncbi:hypothetical protein P344_05995 [Spiroplasma mirum ATCC 29335]|uniref:Uncharacterized protein n=1 Tax=Spiroplasma mirum ATCC 29335 TaxID=838561 RepID=W0GS46_9MOLU|nr:MULTISPECIES: hypothetical protein [Spiroplasma]AHF61381.1 hypothetical protein SMM_1005 [Spiroplasma mirum ATCC 29335]AHI58506.1 hypothetical protein P344_05995 [Spiroplasma mirum ATCC 29335]AKM53431.1 hypothetical protein SATRI_v1c10700 [Spiroplasma atrichopogonis]
MSTLSASLIKQDSNNSKVEIVTIDNVSNKFESHNYWKESYSYIQLHISWHDAKYFLRALKEQDMEEINYFINEWNVLLNNAKDP